MKLRDLEPTFVKVTSPNGSYQCDVPMAEAQGVDFLCPRCFLANSGPVGTHHILCWSRSRGAPDDILPRPGRWALVGTSLDDLTLDSDPPGTARSVQITSGCCAHFYVTNGEVTWA